MSIESILKNKLINNEISLVNEIINYKNQMELSEKIKKVNEELINKCITRSKDIEYFYNTNENLYLCNEFIADNHKTKTICTINEDFEGGYDMEKFSYKTETVGNNCFVYLS